MKQNNWAEHAVIGVLFGGIAFVVMVCGFTMGEKKVQAQAVQHGAARYIVSDKGDVEFQWFYRDQN